MSKLQLKNVTLFGLSTDDFRALEKAATVCLDYADFGAVVMLSADDVPSVDSYDSYNAFMITDLHKYVDTDYVLTIQHDGFILSPDMWDDSFYDYDYIGASWKSVYKWVTTNRVGNGGFSFRSKKLLNRLKDIEVEYGFPEDRTICIENYDLLISEGFTFAPVDIASKFSYEIGVWDGQFGFHSLKYTNINKWIDKDKFGYGVKKMRLQDYLETAQNPSDISEHLAVLMEYGNKCDKIVEFGVRWADGSTIAFLNTRKDIVVESYDIKNIDHNRINELISCANSEGKQWLFTESSSLDVGIETDMLFIDTRHVYSLLKAELSMHCDNVRKYIALHDTTLFAHKGEDGSPKGLMDAVTEFLEDHPEWSICYKVEYNNGLTIMERV